MTLVQFPDVLARVAKLPSSQLEGAGATLRAVLENICAAYPALRAHLMYDNNQFKEHFLFTAGADLIDADDAVPAGVEINVMLATSGGQDVSQLSNDEVRRYVRHITLPDVGREGQTRLKNARVLVIGTGGLGSPVSLYLAAAGIGTLGLIDFDVVESSNLQRQVVHGNSTLGMPKVESAKQRLHDLNEYITIETHNAALNADNALPLIGKYDLVVDGTDNFFTRYLVNDACVQLGKPLVYGAIYRFDGQMSVFNYQNGPCYRCLFPHSPPPELAPNCAAGGVIGVLPGVVGLIQATEAIKLILGIGEPLNSRLMCFDALGMRFREVRYKKRDNCPSCSGPRTGVLPTQSEFVCASTQTAQTRLADDCYIQPKAFHEMMGKLDQAVLLDVRDANELEVCQLPDIVHIPLSELDTRLAELNKDQTHYLICYGGVRAERAAALMQQHGFGKTIVMEGGMKRWVRDVEPDMPIY